MKKKNTLWHLYTTNWWEVMVKIKSKISLVHTLWSHIQGAEVFLYSFLTLALVWGEWLISHPGSITPRTEPWCPLCRRLGGPHIQCGHCGNKFLAPTGIWNPDCPACSIVTVLTMVPPLQLISLERESCSRTIVEGVIRRRREESQNGSDSSSKVMDWAIAE